MKNRVTPSLLFLCVLIYCFFLPSISCGSELTLAIANSTCKPMKKVGKIFTEKTGIKLNYLCQPSGLLALGIKVRAIDVDYFLSANEKWMDEVVALGFIKAESVRNNWGNQLVVVSLPLKGRDVKLQSLADLSKPEVQQIIMGDPDVAP
ncbi:MAG: substrate-binding domain-containing protein, partial [Pseudomonadota bacterium]|nr:substrate-binding domain-containing protein [Pseudomonadota bacterium]